MTTITDTDKSGHGFQKQKVWLGPSLGWSEEYVQPSTLITTGPTYAVQPGDGMLLIDVPAGITILLPDVRTWFQQPATQPATGWNRQLCIKDFGGNAQVGNIVVQPFGNQRIDENIGPTAITINNAIFLLVPNVDLTGWVIAAGTTGVLIPVGTFLPVHDPNATGKLTVREVGGDVLALQGGPAGSQSVTVSADEASVDAVVNIHLIPKSSGGVLMYSNGSLQVAVSGSAGNNKFIALTGGSPGLNPSISSSFGGPVDVRDSVRVGPTGGNRGLVSGSAAGQQAIIYGVDPASPDADVNVHLIPKNNGGTLLYAHNSLQMAVSGPAATTEYLVVSGATGLEDPLIANSSGQPIRLDSAILVGPAGGNFAGLYGSAAAGQAVSLRADNVSNPDENVNIHVIPKGAGSTQFYSNGVPQALVNGPPNTARYVSLMGSPATSNPVIQAAFGIDIDVFNANLTGVPHCPTAAVGTNTTQVASTAFVQGAITGGGSFLPTTGGTLTGGLIINSPTINSDNLVLMGNAFPGLRLAPNVGTSLSGFLYQEGNFLKLSSGSTDFFTIDLTTGATRVTSANSGILSLDKPLGTTGQNSVLIGSVNNNARWGIFLGDSTLEAGGNTGSDFVISRHADNATLLGNALTINRATGVVTIPGLSTTASGVAPLASQYITSVADATLPNERALTDTASITWDRSVAGQIKANAVGVGSGNVSTSGTIQVGQIAVWDSATTIQSMTTAAIGLAPGGAAYLTANAHANLTDERVMTNTATVTWDFSTPGQAKANATVSGGGNVSNSGTPASSQYARWISATAIEGRTTAQVLTDIGAVPLSGSSAINGVIQISPSAGSAQLTLNKPASGQMDIIVANTAGSPRWRMIMGDGVSESGSNVGSNFAIYRHNDAGSAIDTPITINRASGIVTANGLAPLDTPVFVGTPTTSPPAAGDNSLRIATTGFVKAQGYQTSGDVAAAITSTAGDVFQAGANLFTGTNTFRGGPTVDGLSGGAASQVWTNYQNAGGAPNLQLRHSRGTTYGAHAAVAVNDPLGTITFQGSDGVGFANGASIFTFVDAAPVAGHIQSSLRFYIDDGVATAERARIDKGGITSAWRGVTAGTAAAAGDVGEYQEVILGAATTPTVSVVTNIMSLALTAGDWDVWMNMLILPAAQGQMEIDLSASATLSGIYPNYQSVIFFAAGGLNPANHGPFRFFSASPITVTLMVRAGAASQQIAKAFIAARRRR